MPRSLKKGYYVAQNLMKKIRKLNEANKKAIIKTWSRRSMIIPEFVGHTFGVHNGKIFIPVYITSAMLERKLGEFAKTRIFKGHKVGKEKKK
ncbi:MAG: 30S ribosomal protein S19 [Bacteroidota bacterium]